MSDFEADSDEREAQRNTISSIECNTQNVSFCWKSTGQNLIQINKKGRILGIMLLHERVSHPFMK